jgi:disulfide bond formation protein DsbB
VIIIAIMLIGLSILNKTWILLLISLSAIVTGSIGFHHTGIEQGWWSGPTGCSSQFGSETNISTLTKLLLETPVVKCDEIVWSLFNISMAGWNSLVSFFIAIFSFFSWVHIKNKEK